MTGTYCSSCGAERTPGASFCASCGAAVAAPPAAPGARVGSGAPQGAQNGSEHGQEQQPVMPAADQPTLQTYPAQQPPPQPAYPAQQPPPSPEYPPQQPPAPPVHPGQQGQYPGQPLPYAGQQAAYADPSTQYPTQQTPYPAQQAPYPGEQAQYLGQQQPYGGQPQQPWAGNGPYPGVAGQPGAAPWGTAPFGAAPQSGTPGRSPIDSLLTGDWGGAARTAAISVGAMLAVSLVGMLFLTEGGIGFRETLALILAGACLAVGGDAYAEADAEGFGASFSIGLLPLTVTLVGLGLLGWLFAKQVRKLGPTSTTDVLLHGVRTALVFTVFFLPLSLLTRYQADGVDSIGLAGRLGVGVVSTLIGALLCAVLVLGLTALLHRSTVLPGRFGAFREKALAPLFGAIAVFSVGVLAVLAALIYGLIEESDKLTQLGVAVLGAGNGALASVLWSAGVPMNVEGTASATPLGQFTPSGTESVTLFTFTDASAWFWLAPVVLLAAMLLVATALAVRQNTIEDARREGFRFAGALAFVAFVATLLLRIGADGNGAADPFDASAAANGSLMFNPLMAAFVLAIWGVVTGLLAPVVAAKVSSGFVTTVRRRFGAAAVAPTPPAY